MSSPAGVEPAKGSPAWIWKRARQPIPMNMLHKSPSECIILTCIISTGNIVDGHHVRTRRVHCRYGVTTEPGENMLPIQIGNFYKPGD